MKSNKVIIAVLLSLTLLLSEKPTFSVTSGYMFQQWSRTTTAKDELQQSTVPLYVTADISPKLSIDLNLQYAHTQKVADEQTISGINNIALLVSGTPIANKLLLTAGLSIPSGKRELTLEEASVVELLSNENLLFQTNHYGGGAEGLLGIAYATPIGDKMELGLATSGTVRAAYEQTEESAQKYNPGEFLILNGGLSLMHKKMLWGIDLTGRISGKDQLADTAIYQLGPMFISELYYKLKQEKFTLDCSAYTFFIGNASRLSETTLVKEKLNSEGFRFGGSSSILIEISPKVFTTIAFDIDAQNKNEYERTHFLHEGKKLITGGTLIWTVAPIRKLSISLGCGYHQGSIGEKFALSGGEEIKGLDASFDFTVELGGKE